MDVKNVDVESDAFIKSIARTMDPYFTRQPLLLSPHHLAADRQFARH